MKDTLTYQQYYLNTQPPLSPPRLSDHIPAWMWANIALEYRERILNCHRIEVFDNSMNFTTEIDFHCANGETIRLTLTYDTMSHSYFSDDIETFIRAIKPPPLPVISSPTPVLGWRQWVIGSPPTFSEKGMFGLYGKRWETPLMRATCTKGHTAPAEDCRCGIYFLKYPTWPYNEPREGKYVRGIVVATDVIEHEYGYRAGLVRCIGISDVHPEAHGWDGIPVMPGIKLGNYIQSLREDPSLIPYPDDLPAL